MDGHTEIVVKGVLSILALAVIVLRHRRPGRLKPEQAGQLMTAMAVVAVLAYSNFGGFHGSSSLHNWELFHYFLGSKYFPELRYDGLYSASLAAEQELHPDHQVQPYTRDLRSNEVVPSAALVDHGREVRDRFSAERWREFVADTDYFLRSSSPGYVDRIRRDHGYNPTPTWTFVARAFSRWPAAGDGSLQALAWLDPLLLAALFLMIFRTYGSRVGCLALIIFGLGYPWRFYWVGGALLRQDWLVATGLALCLIKKQRHGAAGGLLAYAAMVRVFPGAFLFAAALLAVQAVVHKQPFRWAGRLAAGFSAGVAICALAGCLTGAGASAWPLFFDNLEKHRGTWLTNNVGLKNVVLYDGATLRRDDVDWSKAEPWIDWQVKMNRREEANRPLIVASAALFLAWLGAAVWRRELPEATVLGMAVVFTVVVLTCYYWVMLLLIPLGRGRWAPTAAWLVINTGLYALHLATPAFEMIYGMLSWVLALFFIFWTAPDAVKTMRSLRIRT